MPTLAETFAQLSLTRQKRTVLEHLVSYLENEFIERDEGEPPQTMQVEGTEERVSQDAFSEILELVSDKLIGELQVEEARLGSAEVNFPDEEKPKKKPAKKKRPAPPKRKGKESSDG